MAVGWFFKNYLRSSRDAPPLATQMTAKALLSSIVADADVISDWLYYRDILNGRDKEYKMIKNWQINLQLITCMVGTLAWLFTCTDGKAVYWLRYIFYSIAAGAAYVVERFTSHTKQWGYTQVWGKDALHAFMTERKLKSVFSTGTLVLSGIFLEDIPQVCLTFMLEDVIREERNSIFEISTAASISLSFALFDICHKFADAWDSRDDVLNVGYEFKWTTKAHRHKMRGLREVPGKNAILSIPESELDNPSISVVKIDNATNMDIISKCLLEPFVSCWKFGRYASADDYNIYDSVVIDPFKNPDLHIIQRSKTTYRRGSGADSFRFTKYYNSDEGPKGLSPQGERNTSISSSSSFSVSCGKNEVRKCYSVCIVDIEDEDKNGIRPIDEIPIDFRPQSIFMSPDMNFFFIAGKDESEEINSNKKSNAGESDADPRRAKKYVLKKFCMVGAEEAKTMKEDQRIEDNA